MSQDYRTKVIEIAKSMVGVAFRNGQTCQCAEFVRYVFEKAGFPLGIASHPSDYSLLPPGEPLGPSYADSLAGDEVGARIAKRTSLQAGDIVLFCNTYGNYPPGVITHVGIMVDGMHLVHRPTSARPVELVDITYFSSSCFAEGRRPYYEAKMDYEKAKFFMHDGIGSAIIGQHSGDAILKVYYHENKSRVLAGFIGKELKEYKEASINLSLPHCKVEIKKDGQKFSLMLNQAMEFKGDKNIELVAMVVEGKPSLTYNLGFGKYVASPNFGMEALLKGG